MRASMFEFPEKETKRLVDVFFIIEPRRFHLLKFILEGYDNLAVLSSIERKKGVVRIKTSDDSLHELMYLMADISEYINRPTI